MARLSPASALRSLSPELFLWMRFPIVTITLTNVLPVAIVVAAETRLPCLQAIPRDASQKEHGARRPHQVLDWARSADSDRRLIECEARCRFPQRSGRKSGSRIPNSAGRCSQVFTTFQTQDACKLFNRMARPERFELPTFWFVAVNSLLILHNLRAQKTRN